MKNLLLKNVIVCIVLFSFSLLKVDAQQNGGLINSKLETEKKKNDWLQSDINDYLITDQYTENETGLTHAYIQQRYHNIGVFNAISIFLIKDNKVVYFKSGLIDHLEKQIKTDKPSITAEAAIGYALSHIGKTEIAPVKFISEDRTINTYTFESPSISSRPITVQLVYRAMDKAVVLAWNVSIELKNEPHWWNIRVDALTGDYIDKNDFTVEDNFGVTLNANSPAENYLSPQPSPPSPLAPSAHYNVFAFPVEAPSFGSRTLLNDPSDPAASPFGWHDVNGIDGAEYTITRGNNVYAYEDANNDNLPGYSPDGTSSLTFNFPFNAALAPTGNQDASLTNLFYVNNRVHDVLYHSGFTEAAGNFQKNNYGNGGTANDPVLAEGFDGSGTNNANFSTPADGSSGRMQMYLFNYTSPGRDGSFDNGIITHEFGHGVSNRLTGGPSNSNCLSNAEEGGEGWSDWLGLMMTIKPSDVGTTPRGMGTYVLGQATTGAGIRRFPYSTDMSINPQTYADMAASTEVHNIGEIWCDVIWDMSWFLMEDLGYNSDPTVTTAGNNIAIRLVLEGMKLQPCSPGYIDARNAILTADTVLYNHAHTCRIWEAFARRGMGYSALQGSSNSATDQTAAFDLPPGLPNPTISGNSLICPNEQVTLDAGSFLTYLWSTGATTQTITVNAAGTYTVTVTNATGCPKSASKTITPNAVPVAPTTGNYIICQYASIAAGQGLTSSSTAGGSTTTQNKFSGSPYSSPGPATSLSTINIPAVPAGAVITSAQLKLFKINSLGNSWRSEFRVALTGAYSLAATSVSSLNSGGIVSPDPVINLSNFPSAGGTVSLVLSESYDDAGTDATVDSVRIDITYNILATTVTWWSASTGGSQVGSNSPFNPIGTTSLPNSNTPGDFIFYAQNNSSACNSTRTPATLHINPAPSPSISGVLTFCSGNSTTLDAGAGYSGYNWSTGATTQTISVNTAATFTVTVTNANSCSASTSATTSEVSNLNPTISGSTDICQGSSTQLSANAGFSSYNWSTGATTQSISVNTAGTFTVTVSNASGCTGSQSATTTINPLPNVSFSGLASSYNVNDPAAALTGSPVGGNFSGPGISGNTFTPSSAGAGGPYTITYSYTDAKGCSNSSSQQTTVTNCTQPGTPGTITTTGGNKKVCPGDTRTYSVPVFAGATSYNWIPPAGGNVISGQGTRTATINYTSGFTANSNLQVAVANACGTGPSRTLLISRNLPSTPSAISGSAFGTCNLNGVPYSVTNVAGITYNWSFGTTTADIASGQGTNSITANFGAGYASGQLSVTATNGCATSGMRTLTVKATPATPATISGSSSVCANQSGVPYSTSPVTSAVNYTWSGPTGSHINDGSTTSAGATLVTASTSVTVNFASTGGNVKVLATNACGSGTNRSKAVTVGCRESNELTMDNFHVNVYPIPTKTELNVMFIADKEQPGSIQILDLLGKTLLNHNNTSTIGENKFILDLSTIASGIYMIKVVSGDNVSIQKFTKE